jgi:glucokinase
MFGVVLLMKYIIGFDIGGTKCACILANVTNEDITIIEREQIKTAQNWQDILSVLCNISFNQLNKNKLTVKDVDCVGISCGGPLDSKKGYILSPPNLPGWDNVPIVEFVENILGIKTRLRNDADACAIAEWKYGAGKGYNNVIFLTFGTGLGAGLILNGRLYTGASGMAGECGHIRLAESGNVGYGKIGSFEGFCSGGGIRQTGQLIALEKIQQGNPPAYCKTINELNDITAKSIYDACKNGDQSAIEVYKLTGKYFGKGLSILIDILNPEVIIAGSIYTRSNNLMYNEMMKVLKEECLPESLFACKILPAALEDKIGDYATVVSALDV